MAAHYKYPHSVINNYIADSLESEGLLPKTVTVTQNKRPVVYGTIIGQEMVPAIASGGASVNNYIVFTEARDDNEHNEYQKYETVVYQVFAKGKTAGTDIIEGIIDAVGRRDFTTDDLMDYQLEQRGRETFHFIDIEYNVVGKSEAMNNGNEAGYFMSTIMLRYSYTYDMDDRGRRATV